MGLFKRKTLSPYEVKMARFMEFVENHAKITSHANGDMLVLSFPKGFPVRIEKTRENEAIFIDEVVLTDESPDGRRNRRN